MSEQNLQEVVRQKYGQAAQRVAQGASPCCGDAAETIGCDPITANLYNDAEKAALPSEAVAASLGCGNPAALAQLRPGEIVLDLGSGGGIDVLLSARRVGPAGKAYGLDMTDGMLALAREEDESRSKLGKGGLENVTVEATRVYKVSDAQEFLEKAGVDAEAIAPQVDGKFMSAFVRAVKPATQQACCGPSCCA